MRYLSLIAVAFLFAFTTRPPKHKKLTKEELAYVPVGYVYLHTPARLKKVPMLPLKDSCQAFYIKQGEVTNGEYKTFLAHLKSNNDPQYNQMLPDTTVWREKLAFCEPYVEHYYSHAAYADYPDVGISKKQAEAYCAWRTRELQMQFETKRITARLPTKKEFVRAGRGDKTYQYASGGPYLRNSKGAFLYNFRVVGEQAIAYSEEDSTHKVMAGLRNSMADGGLITTVTKSYFPNQFGVYNMCGNVAELVGDDTVAMGGSWNNTGYDIRLESEMDASQPSSMIGFRYVVVIQ